MYLMQSGTRENLGSYRLVRMVSVVSGATRGKWSDSFWFSTTVRHLLPRRSLSKENSHCRKGSTDCHRVSFANRNAQSCCSDHAGTERRCTVFDSSLRIALVLSLWSTHPFLTFLTPNPLTPKFTIALRPIQPFFSTPIRWFVFLPSRRTNQKVSYPINSDGSSWKSV